MNKKQFCKLRFSISDYAKINFFQISEATKQPTGLFCSCFTFIKKDIALERVKQVLKDLKYPFSVSETGLSNTLHFQIKF